ncbi:bifunctional diaminohydroxyphosphoribosylaminopyrimidine deaminase/5-amino-6-(5-phosphoribosylamino)uracil reductase RibD [Shewanella submarina]|uniref:Riboflavin biosynthesis protein RibD n=1 Tax=Shewanella submarina TaxID=2016376 RepID=A0ABV7GJE1_9GAMM|nr:bifunctional diaminohydroxyphosphoribosylaminopyrimidine deaminase/5-amino-6-(5-phosphoribosylamino)uracil reductase RibD [Shewanella submarina]MCL1036223.1 bifunctional diaminohydroxyphosphoribosylaminopyrimidine deaminase/5-amino-6-(5-phosphoribosylamino)uracil reductase RibD [Shewanella submarina]
MWSAQDIQMMARAIQLAKRGRFTTAPNPNVGCVLTVNDEIVGEGFHIQAGGPHAEVHALRMAGDKSRGATAYVTLEPCSHYGRTPPCAKGLIEAGVARVVVAMTDPNPQVAGRGINMLKDAGIEVQTGLLEVDARALNPGFLTRMETGLPFVTVKVAASLDGKTALSNGVSKWITGPQARADVQRLRARHPALVTGIETILADNPTLNVRFDELGSVVAETGVLDESNVQQPLRVVLDSSARLTAEQASNLFGFASPILLVSTLAYSDAQLAAFPEHVETLVLAAKDGRVDLAALLAELGKRVNAVLVEAGATLAGAFVAADLVDELVLYQAPKLLGSHGRNMLVLPDWQTMDSIPAMTLCDERKIGSDRRYIFSLRRAD